MNTNFETSALISCYKHTDPDFLKQAFKSITCLGAHLTEIVLIIDGPITDTVKEEIESFKFSELKIHKLQKNNGLGKALNIGVKLCTKKWILRMDDDDICYPDRLNKQIKFLAKNPRIDVVGGVIREFKTKGNYLAYRICPEEDGDIKKRLAYRNPLNHVTVLMKREAVIKAGNYSNDVDGYEDYCLWVKMAKSGFVFANLPDVLVDVRFSDKQLMRRSGWKSICSEVKMQRFLFRHGITSPFQFIFNLMLKVILRMAPKFVLKFIFTVFLRKTDN